MSARRRRAATTAAGLTGTALLRFALTGEPGSPRFYIASLGTAGVWTAGAVASGYRVRAGRVGGQGVAPVATGAGAFSAFYAAALVARRIPVLETAISSVLRHADSGSAPLVLTSCANAVGEELFFRGALYAAAGRCPVATSALAYTAATAATGNPALTLAGAAMGLLLAQQRRASGGVQAPVLTHLTWSVLMVRLLPRLFREPAAWEPE
jgi:membrane protease YdiL (CAAX protease family)